MFNCRLLSKTCIVYRPTSPIFSLKEITEQCLYQKLLIFASTNQHPKNCTFFGFYLEHSAWTWSSRPREHFFLPTLCNIVVVQFIIIWMRLIVRIFLIFSALGSAHEVNQFQKNLCSR